MLFRGSIGAAALITALLTTTAAQAFDERLRSQLSDEETQQLAGLLERLQAGLS